MSPFGSVTYIVLASNCIHTFSYILSHIITKLMTYMQYGKPCLKIRVEINNLFYAQPFVLAALVYGAICMKV